MSSKYFLGQAGNYTTKDMLKHTCAYASRKWSNMLRRYLAENYDTDKKNVYLMNNGRSALAAALKSFVPENSEVIINGFTCYAVLQAVEKAGCKVVYADIDKRTLNFTVKTLESALKNHPQAKAIIIQNTLGICVDITKIEEFAKKHHLVIIEDLAHCAGFTYPDGRKVGSVGVASALSFGKGKSLDAITGGALVLNQEPVKPARFGYKAPKLSDSLRARFYPLLAAIGRGMTKIHLQKYWYGPLIRLHFIERAVDAKLNYARRPAHWQAKLILKQLLDIEEHGAKPIRTHRLVNDRAKVLDKLEQAGYNFREVWYDVPVSPVRYYKQVNFDESACPVATEVSAHIVNIPTYYEASELNRAIKIIEGDEYAKN
ncbi:aminotransferase class I/II-fold pyridoxal phosphate-dependent enzyme [Candidatus Saccharibacteria bacterium]|nr:aminotransferase class I/II-fold pyridoxal phosphate-dependent enzyme [Candidatus Saccharibacteria bacterium]